VQGRSALPVGDAAARELLRHTDASVKEIAFQLGYCHQFHFANEFTRLAGMSPGPIPALRTARTSVMRTRSALAKTIPPWYSIGLFFSLFSGDFTE